MIYAGAKHFLIRTNKEKMPQDILVHFQYSQKLKTTKTLKEYENDKLNTFLLFLISHQRYETTQKDKSMCARSPKLKEWNSLYHSFLMTRWNQLKSPIQLLNFFHILPTHKIEEQQSNN